MPTLIEFLNWSPVDPEWVLSSSYTRFLDCHLYFVCLQIFLLPGHQVIKGRVARLIHIYLISWIEDSGVWERELLWTRSLVYIMRWKMLVRGLIPCSQHPSYPSTDLAADTPDDQARSYFSHLGALLWLFLWMKLFAREKTIWCNL